MVRNNISLKQAALDLDLQLDPEELERISRRPEFKEILRAEGNKFYAIVGTDPTRTKSAAIGKMWVQAELLHQQGDFDKAAAVLEKIGKMEGWTSADSNVNIFGDLTARELKEAKLELEGKLGKPTTEPLPN